MKANILLTQENMDRAVSEAVSTRSLLAYRWRDSKALLHSPSKMETRHLFMTLVLIWNNLAPEEALIHKSGTWTHHLRRLSSENYSIDYLLVSVRMLSQELRKRKDVLPEWQETLNKMVAFLSRVQIAHTESQEGDSEPISTLQSRLDTNSLTEEDKALLVELFKLVEEDYEYETEYDHRMESYCKFCASNLENGHSRTCLRTRLLALCK